MIWWDGWLEADSEQATAGIQRHCKSNGRNSQKQSRSHGRNARKSDPLGNEKDYCEKIVG
jgi:hypothetical protein